MEKQKIGTLRCKIFGHKFIESQWVVIGNTTIDGEYRKIPTDYCTRCGKNKK